MAEPKLLSSDAYSPYEAGLRLMLDKLGRDHPHYSETLVYQQRLTENISQARRYGDTDTRKSERAEVIDRLNELSLTMLGLSFNELCDQASSSPTCTHEPPDGLVHKPRIFLCHAKEDKPRVKELYHQLKEAGYHPWLDEEDLLPGQDWWAEIKKIISNPYNLVVVCLSAQSVTKRGVVQREIKRALDMLDQMPERAIYLIPAHLERCQVPDRLSQLHWVNLFERQGFEKLRQALDFEVNKRNISPSDEWPKVAQIVDQAGSNLGKPYQSISGVKMDLATFRDFLEWLREDHLTVEQVEERRWHAKWAGCEGCWIVALPIKNELRIDFYFLEWDEPEHLVPYEDDNGGLRIESKPNVWPKLVFDTVRSGLIKLGAFHGTGTSAGHRGEHIGTASQMPIGAGTGRKRGLNMETPIKVAKARLIMELRETTQRVACDCAAVSPHTFRKHYHHPDVLAEMNRLRQDRDFLKEVEAT